jgi:excisionase family DNA binding protein
LKKNSNYTPLLNSLLNLLGYVTKQSYFCLAWKKSVQGGQMDNSLQVQESQPIGPRFLSISQVGKLIGISRSTLFRQIKDGRIAHVRVGNRVLISATYLEGLMAQATKNKEVKA